MEGRTDWSYAAGEWRRPLGRRRLAVYRSAAGAWAWRVESARMILLDDGEEDSLNAAREAAERRGALVMSIRCHALRADGTGMDWDMVEDDIPLAEDLERAGFPRI